ncbi:MAG: hypothetical protein ACTHLZ_17795 [Tepidisphaeraceae bacterium]
MEGGRITNAFQLSFNQWPPASVSVRHGIAAPIGAIRIATSGKSKHREIKVRLDGPPQHRWLNLARFWWLKNKGPVPPGKRVAHVDGDTLNDDPRNYALFTPGDVLVGYHLDHPKWSKAQHKRKSAGCARSNRERAHVERMRRWLADRWYAVDFAQRRIYNEPHREQWQVYAAHGAPVKRNANGRGYGGAVLGWPGVDTYGAVILATLARAEPGIDSFALFSAVKSLYSEQRWPQPRFRSSMASALTPLRRRGFVATQRRGRRSSLHTITPAGREARQAICPVIAVKGSELDAEQFRLFERVIPEAAAA